MTRKILTLQQSGEKYSVNLPKQLIDSLSWKKGDKIELHLDKEVNANKVNSSRILLFNPRLNPYKGGPISLIIHGYLIWNEAVRNLKGVPYRDRIRLLSLKNGFEENSEKRSSSGIDFDKFPKEVSVNHLIIRRNALRQDLKKITSDLKRIRRKKVKN